MKTCTESEANKICYMSLVQREPTTTRSLVRIAACWHICNGADYINSEDMHRIKLTGFVMSTIKYYGTKKRRSTESVEDSQANIDM